MLTITNLHFSYRQNHDVLKNISLSMDERDILFLIGANGAGKSTLLKNILGLVRPDSGSVRIENSLMNTKNRLEIIHNVGVLLENASFYGHLTVKENISIIAAYYNDISQKQIQDTISILGLESVQNRLASELSTGFKQRLGLAMSIVHKPKIVFLDEPTNGLDPQNIIDFRELIINLNKNYGVSFFITTHILTEVEKLSTKVAIIRDGTIIDSFQMSELNQKMETLIDSEISKGGLEDYYLFKCNQYDKTHKIGV